MIVDVPSEIYYKCATQLGRRHRRLDKDSDWESDSDSKRERERQLIKYLYKCGGIYILHLLELHTHNEGPQLKQWEEGEPRDYVCVRVWSGKCMSDVGAGAATCGS